MSIDFRDGRPAVRPSLREASQRELRWQLQQILHALGVREGGFRAATGQWPVELGDDELRAWLSWFNAETEQLPELLLKRIAERAAQSEQSGPGEHMQGGQDQGRPRPGPRGGHGEYTQGGYGGQDQGRPRPAPRAPQAEQFQGGQDQGRPRPAPRVPQAEQPQVDQQRERPAARGGLRAQREEPAAPPAPQEQEQAAPALGPEEQTFLEELRRGTTVQKAAQLAGVATHTLYQRRRRNPVFEQAWQAALVERGARGGVDSDDQD